MAEVVLHQWQISPFCGKVRKILRLKGIPYRVENYNGLRATMVGKLTSAAKLPVLDLDGKRIPDSTAIAAYLNERQPEPALYPSDRCDAAMARIIEDWADESLYYYEMFFRSNFLQLDLQRSPIFAPTVRAGNNLYLRRSSVARCARSSRNTDSLVDQEKMSRRPFFAILTTSKPCFRNETGWLVMSRALRILRSRRKLTR